MGGRGAYSYTAARMPRFKHAEISRPKIKDYLASPKNTDGKAAFFKAIGYTTRNADKLVEDIRKGLQSNPASITGSNGYGRVSIQVIMELGITKRAKVLTGWCIEPGEKNPKLITAYPYKEK